ncbi:DUF29 domain-containing protein [Cyanothece sp. BG0011]|nr:DUF29 domain-containing protein [Cyanothece sp. BG0011]
MVRQLIMSANLYESDFNLWLEETINNLKNEDS